MAIKEHASQTSNERPTLFVHRRMEAGVMKMPEPMIFPITYEVAPTNPILWLSSMAEKKDIVIGKEKRHITRKRKKKQQLLREGTKEFGCTGGRNERTCREHLGKT